MLHNAFVVHMHCLAFKKCYYKLYCHHYFSRVEKVSLTCTINMFLFFLLEHSSLMGQGSTISFCLFFETQISAVLSSWLLCWQLLLLRRLLRRPDSMSSTGLLLWLTAGLIHFGKLCSCYVPGTMLDPHCDCAFSRGVLQLLFPYLLSPQNPRDSMYS